jgi:hypothetical protein
MIRIVGLSATLPNYQDVAAFLRVHPTSGLFHFDASYRPVPLGLAFCGVMGHNVMQRNAAMNQICYDKVGGWGWGWGGGGAGEGGVDGHDQEVLQGRCGGGGG